MSGKGPKANPLFIGKMQTMDLVNLGVVEMAMCLNMAAFESVKRLGHEGSRRGLQVVFRVGLRGAPARG